MILSPPIIIVLAYGAGLATGLLHFEVPGLVILAPVLVLLWTRRPMVSLTAGIGLLGAMSGALARAGSADDCAVRLAPGNLELTVRLAEPMDAGGGSAILAPVGAGCGGRLTARWPAGTSVAVGEVWRVEARWVAPNPEGGARRGVLIVAGGTRLSARPTISERLRSGIARTTATLYGDRAPLVDALILNRRGSLDPETSEAYARSGLVHILSISGFHVGVIAAWLYLLGRLGRLSRTRATLLAAIASALYVAFLGWPAPATRAAALVVLLAVCRWRQRQVEPDALLAVTCLLVLMIDPRAIFDLGAWLSAAALWGATRFSRWSDRSLGPAWGWRMLGSSAGATLATAPFTAAALGSVALVGIALNFAAIPLAAIAVPGVLASVLLYPVVPSVASALAAGSGAGLNLLDGLALAGAGMPGGHVIQPVDISSAVPWILLLGFMVWSLGRRNPTRVAVRRWSWGIVAVVWGSLTLMVFPVARDKGSVLTLHFLQVGQGDGAAVRTPGGHWVIIDAGPRFEGSDAGKRVVVPFLRRQGVRRLAAVVVSHVHADHLGGVPAVLDRFPADVVLEPGDLSDDPRYHDFLNLLDAQSIRWHPGRPGDRFEIDSVSFILLHPDTTWVEWGGDLNEDSIVLLLRYRGFEALFTGDAGLRAELLLVRKVGPVDLLKVGHHGSRTATGNPLLDRTRPKAAVISVGSNTYGHPSPETLGRLGQHRIPVWRTDQDGEITVTTDGVTMSVCGNRGCTRSAVNP